MRKYKTIDSGYIVSVGTGTGGTEITEAEYNELLSIIHNRPTPQTGFDYKLRAADLEWELVKLPPVEPEPLTDEEALTRYANELTGQNDPDLLSAAETLIKQRMED